MSDSEQHEIRRLKSQIAVLEELLSVQDRTVLEQSVRLEQALRQAVDATLELKSSEAGLRLIISSALDSVVTMDAEGRIAGWNPQAEATFGWSGQEAIGKMMSEMIIPPQHREAHERGLNTFLKTGEGPVL